MKNFTKSLSILVLLLGFLVGCDSDVEPPKVDEPEEKTESKSAAAVKEEDCESEDEILKKVTQERSSSDVQAANAKDLLAPKEDEGCSLEEI